VSDVEAAEQSVLTLGVALAVDGPVESLHAAPTNAISVHMVGLPRPAAIRESIKVSVF